MAAGASDVRISTRPRSAVSWELAQTSAACCSGESSSPKAAWMPPCAFAGAGLECALRHERNACSGGLRADRSRQAGCARADDEHVECQRRCHGRRTIAIPGISDAYSLGSGGPSRTGEAPLRDGARGGCRRRTGAGAASSGRRRGRCARPTSTCSSASAPPVRRASAGRRCSRPPAACSAHAPPATTIARMSPTHAAHVRNSLSAKNLMTVNSSSSTARNVVTMAGRCRSRD